jgi:tetratricopeptide (TPR) repeat protein
VAAAVTAQTPRRTKGFRWGRIASWLLALAVSCGVVYHSLHRWEDVRKRDATLLSVPPGNVVRLISSGYRNLLADVFYMRFTTYWGYWLTHGHRFHNLYPLLDLVTELDPHFKSAYEVGSLALADSKEVGRAVDLLLKGAHYHPKDYWYLYQSGMMLFLYGEDYLQAAKYFEMASRLPGAPADAQYFAARMYLVGGQRELARDRWLTIYIEAVRSSDKSRQEVATRSLKRYKVGQQERDLIDVYILSDDLDTRQMAAWALRRKDIDILKLDPGK